MFKIDTLITVLKETNLFFHFPLSKLEELLKNPLVKKNTYTKDESIVFEGDTCNNLSIVISGEVHIQQNNSFGNTLTVSKLLPKNMFGENLIFSNKMLYPVDVISKANSMVLHIDKKLITILLMEDEKFLTKFLNLLSNKSIILSSKLRQLNMKSLRERISSFLLNESKKQNSLTITLYSTKEELAKNFGVQRPSLSRELINMKNEGIISYDRKTITILEKDKLNIF